jgi:hypothetical protein
MRRTSTYYSNAGFINSHVAEVTFLGNRNASANAALWVFGVQLSEAVDISKIQHVCMKIYYLFQYLMCNILFSLGSKSMARLDGAIGGHGWIAPPPYIRHWGAATERFFI